MSSGKSPRPMTPKKGVVSATSPANASGGGGVHRTSLSNDANQLHAPSVLSPPIVHGHTMAGGGGSKSARGSSATPGGRTSVSGSPAAGGNVRPTVKGHSQLSPAPVAHTQLYSSDDTLSVVGHHAAGVKGAGAAAAKGRSPRASASAVGISSPIVMPPPMQAGTHPFSANSALPIHTQQQLYVGTGSGTAPQSNLHGSFPPYDVPVSHYHPQQQQQQQAGLLPRHMLPAATGSAPIQSGSSLPALAGATGAGGSGGGYGSASAMSDAGETQLRAMLSTLTKEQVIDWAAKQHRLLRAAKEREDSLQMMQQFKEISGGSGSGSGPGSSAASPKSGYTDLPTINPHTGTGAGRGGGDGSPSHGSMSAGFEPNHFTNAQHAAAAAAHKAKNEHTIDPERMLQVNELICSNTLPEILLQRIVEASSALVNAEHINLWLVDEFSNELVCHASKGPDSAVTISGFAAASASTSSGRPTTANTAAAAAASSAGSAFTPRGSSSNRSRSPPMGGGNTAANSGRSPVFSQRGLSSDAKAGGDALPGVSPAFVQSDSMTAEIDGDLPAFGGSALGAIASGSSRGVNRSSNPDSDGGLTGMRVPFGSNGIMGYVGKTGKSVNVANVRRDWRFSTEVDSRRGIAVTSLLTVPVRSMEGKTIALLEALNSRNDSGFTSDEEALLKSMACSASTMLRLAELEKQLSSQIKQTEALVAIAELTSNNESANLNHLGVDRVIEKIVRASKVVVNAQRITLYMIDETNNDLVEAFSDPALSRSASGGAIAGSSGGGSTRPGTSHHRSSITDIGSRADANAATAAAAAASGDAVAVDSSANRLRMAVGEGVAGHVALTGRPANVADASQDWRFGLSPEEKRRSSSSPLRSVLAIPVKDNKGKTVAVVEAVNKPKTELGGAGFSHEDFRLLQSLAATAASVLRQAQLFDEAVTRRKQTEALRQITELMAADIGTDMVVPRIIDAAYKLVHAERISFFSIVDKRSPEHQKQHSARRNTMNISKPHPAPEVPIDPSKTKELVCTVSKDPAMIGMRIGWGVGIVGHVGLTLKSLNIADVRKDARWNPTADKTSRFATKSILTVPVIDSEHRGVAVIQAINRQGGDGAFHSEDIAILETLAISAGIILRKNQLISGLMISDKKSRALMNLLKVVSMRDSSMEKVINGIVQVAYDALSADRVTIYFVDNAEMFSMVSHDLAGARFPVGQGIAGSVAQNGTYANIRDVYEDVRFDRSFDEKSGYRTKSMLVMPVKDYDGKVLAVVQALNKRNTNTGPSPSGGANGSGAGASSPGLTKKASSTQTTDSLSGNAPTGGMISKEDSMRYLKQTSGGLSGAGSPTSPDRPSLSSSGSTGDLKSGGNALASLASKATVDESAFTSFDVEDEELLEAFCIQIRATIRKCLTDAILKEAVLDRQVESLVELYTDSSESKTRFSANLSLDKMTTEFKWPKTLATISAANIPDLKSRDFDVWKYDDNDLLAFTVHIFQELGLVDTYSIKLPTLKNFLLAVQAKYNANPFHNWKHGFSVMHFSYLTLLQTKAAVKCLTTPDVLALLVSSLCHDIDHPGVTNAFEINSGSNRALVHNDISVLENHHAYQTFVILREQKCDILKEIRKETRTLLRKVMVMAILSTDMAAHLDATHKLASVESVDSFDRNNEKDRQFLLNTFIHTSDLSAQVLPTPVAVVWEAKITEEFAAQAALEEKKKMAVAPFMQGLNIPKTRYKLQVNFIDFVLVSWWKNVARVFPSMKPCYEQLLINRKYYEALTNSSSSSPPPMPSPSSPADSKSQPAATAIATSGGATLSVNTGSAAAVSATPTAAAPPNGSTLAVPVTPNK